MDTDGKIKNGASGRKNDSPRKKSMSRSVKAGLQFPVKRISRYLKKGRYAQCVGSVATVYLTVVLEYVVAKVLDVVGTGASANMKNRITTRHVVLAMRKDDELGKLLAGVTIAHDGVVPNINPIWLSKEIKKAPQNPKSPSKATKSPQKT